MLPVILPSSWFLQFGGRKKNFRVGSLDRIDWSSTDIHFVKKRYLPCFSAHVFSVMMWFRNLKGLYFKFGFKGRRYGLRSPGPSGVNPIVCTRHYPEISTNVLCHGEQNVTTDFQRAGSNHEIKTGKELIFSSHFDGMLYLWRLSQVLQSEFSNVIVMLCGSFDSKENSKKVEQNHV